MATVYGDWAGSGNQRMRLIISYSVSNDSDSKCTVDITLKLEVDWGISDSDNTLTRSGNLFDDTKSSAIDLDIATGKTETIWTGTKTVARDSGDIKKSMAFKLEGVNFVGKTASVSTSVTIPKVPAPSKPGSVSITRVSLTSVKVTWSGGTAHHIQVRKRSADGNGSASWGDWSTVSDQGDAVSSGKTISVVSNRDYEARVRRKNAAGVYSDYGYSSNSARLYDKPGAPSKLAVTRSSDSSWKLTLTGTATAIVYVDIERYNKIKDAWSAAASGLKGSTRSWTDSANMADNVVRWRAKFRNSAGSSGWVYSDYLWSTPAASSKPQAVRSGSSVVVTWVNEAHYAEKINLRAASSSDGGVTFTAYSNVAGHTGLAPTTTSRTVTGFDAAKLWKLETATIVTTPQTLTAYSGGGNVLQLAAKPNAPTLLGPSAVQATGEDVTISWRHNPVDGSDQTAATVWYQIQDRSADAVTTAVTGTAQALDIGVLDAGVYEYKVLTTNGLGDSVYSAVKTFEVANPPAVSIIAPVDGGVVTASRLTVTAGWDDTLDAVPLSWDYTVLDGDGTELERSRVTTPTLTDSTYTIRTATKLADGAEYTVQLSATAGTGLVSGTAEATFTVDFVDPFPPYLSADWNDATGAVVSVVINTPGEPGAPLATNEALNPSMVDGGATVAVPSDTAKWAVELVDRLPVECPAGVATGARVTRVQTDPVLAEVTNLDGLDTAGVARWLGAWVLLTETAAQGEAAPLLADGTPAPAVATLEPDTWVWITWEVAAATSAALRVTDNAAELDGAVYITGVVAAATEDELSNGFFDGSHALPGMATAWTDVPNASSSTLATKDTADAVANRLEMSRDGGAIWETIAEGLDIDSGYIDGRVPLNTPLLYRAIAITAQDVEAISDEVPFTAVSERAWLTNDPEDVSVSLWGDLELQPTFGQEVVLESYLGRVSPEAYFGVGRPVQVQLSATQVAATGLDLDMTQLLGKTVFYRDPAGRAFDAVVTADGVALPQSKSRYRKASLTVEKIEGVGQ